MEISKVERRKIFTNVMFCGIITTNRLANAMRKD